MYSGSPSVPLPAPSLSVFSSIARRRTESRLGLAAGTGKASRSPKPQTAGGHLAACSAFPGRQADELFQQGSHPKSTTPALPKKSPAVSATENMITMHGLSLVLLSYFFKGKNLLLSFVYPLPMAIFLCYM